MQNAQLKFSVEHAARMRRFSFVALVIVVASYGAWTTGIPEAEETGTTPLLFAFVTALLSGTWCLFDGRVRGKPPTEAGLLGIFLVVVVGFPIYCIWSRGRRGVLFCLGYVGVLAFAGIAGVAVAFLMGVPLPE